MSDGRDTDSMMDSSASEMLVNMNYSSLEEFYPAVAIATLMRVVKDQTLSQHHNSVVTAVMFIFKSLGVRSVPYIKQVRRIMFMFGISTGYTCSTIRRRYNADEIQN